MEGLDGGWDVSSQEVLGCEGRPRRRDVAAPERVDLTADGADGTDMNESERMAASMALSRTSDFAPPRRTLHGVSLIREIREIRGRFFAGHA